MEKTAGVRHFSIDTTELLCKYNVFFLKLHDDFSWLRFQRRAGVNDTYYKESEKICKPIKNTDY
jgi:hypothetical protein